MDSYGVVAIGDHLLSVPGLVTYLVAMTLGFLLVGRVLRDVPVYRKKGDWVILGLSVIAVVTWAFTCTFLDFYVEA